MKIIKTEECEDVMKVIRRPLMDARKIEPVVADIMKDVKERGDEAVREYTSRFDRADIAELLVSEQEIKEAEARVDEKLKDAIMKAKNNIELFHASQLSEVKVRGTMPGVYCWQKSVAIQNVGLYIPGGTAPLFSTVLMLAVPANVAGCSEIIMCSPPDNSGKINPAILYTASICGVTKIFKAGGAQAIAAMAYGCKSIPAVNKIFGPGNQFVTTAKQLASKEGIAIDMPAGPSEVMVVADESAVPEFIAADLLSQAEHGADSQSVLLTTNKDIAEEVLSELTKQKELLSRKVIIEKALENSAIIIARDRDELIDIMNEYAPEHLILSVKDPEGLAHHVINAGSVFLGNYCPESAGDYASGTNHTLPTNGFAKGWSGLSLDSFMKKISFQKISEDGLKILGPIVETMAEAEGLDGHAAAVRRRLKIED